MISLRQQLRQITREPHDRLDALMRPLDVSKASGLGVFLQIQHYALRHLVPVIAQSQQFSFKKAYLRSIELDLTALSVSAATFPAFKDIRTMHPLGATYVVAGSHSGAKLMLKRWLESDDPQVIKAGHYLRSASEGDIWPEVSDYLKSCRLGDREEKDVLQSALLSFALYEHAYELTTLGGTAVDIRQHST